MKIKLRRKAKGFHKKTINLQNNNVNNSLSDDSYRCFDFSNVFFFLILVQAFIYLECASLSVDEINFTEIDIKFTFIHFITRKMRFY